jgi:4-carboxymuconolactone decarboxylase
MSVPQSDKRTSVESATRPDGRRSPTDAASQDSMTNTQPFGTFGRYTEIPINDMTPDQKKGYDLVVRQRGQAPGPYKIWLQNAPLMDIMVPMGVYFQEGHSSLAAAEREIAINLINAKWLAAYSTFEHEIIGERAGLPPEKLQALIAGLPTSFDDPRQQVIYEIALALITPRVVPAGLYQRAVELLGDKGLTDLTVLIGYFTCVSLTLRAYDVPSNAVGLER